MIQYYGFVCVSSSFRSLRYSSICWVCPSFIGTGRKRDTDERLFFIELTFLHKDFSFLIFLFRFFFITCVERHKLQEKISGEFSWIRSTSFWFVRTLHCISFILSMDKLMVSLLRDSRLVDYCCLASNGVYLYPLIRFNSNGCQSRKCKDKKLSTDRRASAKYMKNASEKET